MPEKRARLLKVLVQAVFVIDDGEALSEFRGPAVEVPATHWDNFSVSSFKDDDLANVLTAYEETLKP